MEQRYLDKEINRLISLDREINSISRNIFIFYGENISELEIFFNQNEFAVGDEKLRAFWKWLNLNEQDVKKENIQKALIDLASLQTVDDLYDIDDRQIQAIAHTIQIFLIFDLPSSQGPTKLLACLESLRQVIEELSLQKTVRTIAILSVRRLENNSVLKLNEDEFRNLYDQIKEHIDRIFLIQYQNGQLLITSPEQWNTLISILLFYLAVLPTQLDVSEYHEDLARHRPLDHGVSAFAAKKFVLPISEIAKYILLLKGSELLRETYINIPKEEVLNQTSRGIFAKIMVENPVENEESFSRALLEKTHDDLLDPTAELDSVQPDLTPKQIVQVYRSIINKLDDYSQYNYRVLKSYAQKLYGNYNYSLTGIFDEVLNSAKGAASIALRVVEDLFSHLVDRQKDGTTHDLMNEKDSRKALESLEEEANKLPELSAAILRLLPFLFFSVIVLNQIYCYATVYRNELFIGWMFITISTIIGAFIQWHASQNRFRNALIHLQNILRNNWQQRLQNMGRQLYGEFLPNYIEQTEVFKKDIENLYIRLKYVFEYIHKNYIPNISPDNTFWQNVVQTKEEMALFSRFVQDDFIYQEPKHILKKRILKLWWRVSEGTAPLNPLEWEILEKTALRLLPYSNRLFEYSICNFLNDHSDKREIINNHLSDFYSPFILLDSNKLSNILYDHAITCWKKESCENEQVIDQVLNSLRTVIPDTKLEKSWSPFYFTVLSIQDGIEIHSLLR